MRDPTDAVLAFITATEPPPEPALGRLALKVFAWQYEHLDVVRRVADRAGRTPAQVDRWQDIPAVPTSAFKHFDLFGGETRVRTFESSGTRGAARSRAHFSAEGLRIMDAAIERNARQMLFPDGRTTRLLVLAPPPEAAPTMIMAYGMARLIEHFGRDGSGFFIGPDGMDTGRLLGALREAADAGVPITLIGASFGFVHLLDGMADAGLRIPCAPGSRAMDAGGFKGRSRIVDRAALDAAVGDRLGIPEARCVNLLGMTELASQIYDGVLAEGSAAARRKRNPHWTRTRVLDPVTMTPAESGLLVHLDLANIERPLVIQTDDLGRADGDGWDIVGRARGSDAKGCSLTVEELLAAHG